MSYFFSFPLHMSKNFGWVTALQRKDSMKRPSQGSCFLPVVCLKQ